MALSFTDDQLKDISKTRVQYPENLAAAIQGKAKIQETADAAFEKDESNKQFTDFYLDIVNNYHQQYQYSAEVVKSLFPGEANIQDAGKRGSIHFPVSDSFVWAVLFPMTIDSLNGNPTSGYSGISEVDSLLGATSAIDLIKNGFSDGSHSTNSSTLYTVGDTSIFVDDVTGFSNGQRILVLSGSLGMFATITNIIQDAGFCTGGSNPGATNPTDCTNGGGVWTAPLTGELELDILSPPAGNIPSGASVSNNAGGFSNEQREESVGLTPGEQATLDIYKGVVDDAVQSHEDLMFLTIRPLVESNEDQKEKASRQQALDDIDDIKSEIDDWQSFPSTNPSGTGTESRFGDIKLDDLSTSYVDRNAQVSAQAVALAGYLGSLAQDPGTGEFSGDGRYYDYFDWMNKRVHAATGSLSTYNNLQIALSVSDVTIANLNSDKDETDSLFVITKITEDPTGTATIKVDSTVGYNNGDPLKVIGDGLPIINTTIVTVGSGELILSDPIPATYGLGAVGRVLKEL